MHYGAPTPGFLVDLERIRHIDFSGLNLWGEDARTQDGCGTTHLTELTRSGQAGECHSGDGPAFDG